MTFLIKELKRLGIGAVSLESVDFFAAPRDHCLGFTLLRQLIEGVWADFRRIPFTNP